jgi:hypothetical protein
MYKRLCIGLATLLFLAAPALAQFSSAMQGIVQDNNQAVIRGASVKLKSLQTGLTQETRTNDAGY